MTVLFKESFATPIDFKNAETIDITEYGYWRLFCEAGWGNGSATVLNGKLELETPVNASYEKSEVSIDVGALTAKKLVFKEKVVFPRYTKGTWGGDWGEFMLCQAWTKDGIYYQGRLGVYAAQPISGGFTAVLRIHTTGAYQWGMKDLAEVTFLDGHTYQLEVSVDTETLKYISIVIKDLTTGEVWNIDKAIDGKPVGEHDVKTIGNTSAYYKRADSLLFYTWLRSGSDASDPHIAYIDDCMIESIDEPKEQDSFLLPFFVILAIVFLLFLMSGKRD